MNVENSCSIRAELRGRNFDILRSPFGDTLFGISAKTYLSNLALPPLEPGMLAGLLFYPTYTIANSLCDFTISPLLRFRHTYIRKYLTNQTFPDMITFFLSSFRMNTDAENCRALITA